MSRHTGQKDDTTRRALAASRGTFIGLGVFSLFTSILMLTGPLYMLQVYDRVLMSYSVPTLIALTILVAVLYLTLGIIEWCRSSLFGVAASQIEGRLSQPVMQAAFRNNLSDPGRTSDHALRDLRTVRRFIASPALPALFDAPFAPLFFVVLFMLHWAYGVWALIGGGILIAAALINQSVNRRSIEAAEREERVASAHAGELLRQAEVVAALGMSGRMSARWQAAFDSSDAAMVQSGSALSGFSSGTKAFRLLMQSGILGLGAYLSIMGVSTPGAMIAASIIMGRAIAPLEQSIGQWRSIAQAVTSWRSIRELLSAAPDASSPMPLPRIEGRVAFEQVIAAPPGQRTPVLKRISFTLAPGEAIGVIGPSASGKSTLARVLVGLWPTMSGTVRLDGAELSAFDRDLLGAQIGYLPQRVDLFAGTVRENICRFDPDAPPEAIVAAAQVAGCHDLILRLPDGYDSQVGQAGAYLSDGQKQRIGLARALYGDPALLVLDEPNSNLDAEGDAALLQAVRSVKARGASVLIIAHRPNAITHCDTLMVLREGEIAIIGPREEVMAKLTQPAGGSSAPGVTIRNPERTHG